MNLFKNIIYLFTVVTLLQSCYKDDSSGVSIELPDYHVTGIPADFVLNSRIDQLHVNPKFDADFQESDYSFLWLLYSENFNNNTGVVASADTLSSTKDINYFITQEPGSYILTFQIKHNQTGVSKILTYPLTITTTTMTGWYFLKEYEGKTDFDFYYPDGVIKNWFLEFNGQSLQGTHGKSVFVKDMKTSLTSTDLFSAFGVITDQDVAFFNVENGQKVYSFEDMFFSVPSIKKPENILAPMDGSVVLINDGRAYTRTNGTLFANPAVNSYHFSSKAAVTSNLLLYDELSKTMVYSSFSGYSQLLSNGDPLKNTGSDLWWFEGYPSLRNTAALILKDPATLKGRLMTLNTAYANWIIATNPLIVTNKEIPAENPILNAEVIAGNYDNDMLYYAKDNELYLMDFVSLQSTLQASFAPGEEITCIQHIKYPVPVPGAQNKVNHIAVATYSNGKYKIYLFSITSLGTLVAKTSADYEGEGRVSCIHYLENGQGSRVF